MACWRKDRIPLVELVPTVTLQLGFVGNVVGNAHKR